MRAFIAVDLPETIKENLIRFIDDCRRIQTRLIKYVEKENLHLTLKFLGEAESNRIEGLSKELRTIKSARPEILVRNTRGFPNVFFPKVIWAGIQENENLNLLFMKIEEYSVKSGFEKENRSFNPHLTIARVKGNPDKELLTFLKENKNLDFGSFKADEFKLYESKLTSGGPVYSVIETVYLGQEN